MTDELTSNEIPWPPTLATQREWIEHCPRCGAPFTVSVDIVRIAVCDSCVEVFMGWKDKTRTTFMW